MTFDLNICTHIMFSLKAFKYTTCELNLLFHKEVMYMTKSVNQMYNTQICIIMQTARS